jgi:hypothetical protein
MAFANGDPDEYALPTAAYRPPLPETRFDNGGSFTLHFLSLDLRPKATELLERRRPAQ